MQLFRLKNCILKLETPKKLIYSNDNLRSSQRLNLTFVEFIKRPFDFISLNSKWIYSINEIHNLKD